MRMSRLSLLLPAVLALALGGCFSAAPHYAQDPSVPPLEAAAPVVYAAPAASAPAPRGFFTANLGGPFARAPAYAAYPQAVMAAPYLLDAGARPRIPPFGPGGPAQSSPP